MLPNLIVPTLTRYDLLERLVASFDYPIAHLLIIDNGGGLPELHTQYVEKVTVLRMPSNLGVAGSWNLGVKSFPFAEGWWFASDDVEFLPGGMRRFHDAMLSDCVTVSDQWPHWELFAVGEQVVSDVGLFDEMIYPANWEDDEYSWRVRELGFNVVEADIPHKHMQQGTVFSTAEFRERNAVTYATNESYFRGKVERQDLSAGGWSLTVRRGNSWD